MSIYPDRDRSGNLTGHFRIEVQKGTKRLRGRAPSLPEARKLEAQLKASIDTGAEASKPRGPIASVAAKCLTVRQASDRAKSVLWAKQRTEDESLKKLERLVTLAGEDLPLDDLDINKVDEIVSSLKETGISDATVNRYLSCLSAFLRFCQKRKFRTAEPIELDWKEEDEGRIRWLTYEEEQRLMELLPAPYSTIVFIAIRTGMRASELLTLKPDQVEKKWIRLWKTKNGSARSVPINADLYKVIEPLVRKKEIPTYWQLRWEWEKARKEMGMLKDHGFVFHACRHTFATRAVQANVNIRVLQKLMGHRSIQTTLRYASVDDRTLADAAIAALDFHKSRFAGVNAGGRPPTLHRGERLEPQKSAVLQTGVSPHRDCKSVYAGSIPARASSKINGLVANDDE